MSKEVRSNRFVLNNFDDVDTNIADLRKGVRVVVVTGKPGTQKNQSVTTFSNARKDKRYNIVVNWGIQSPRRNVTVIANVTGISLKNPSSVWIFADFSRETNTDYLSSSIHEAKVEMELFIKRKKLFSVDLLTTAYSRLSVIQLQNNCITHEDIDNSLRSLKAGRLMSAADIAAHAGLLLESIISVSTSATGNVVMAVNSDVVGNDLKFIQVVLNVLALKCEGMKYPLEIFESECESYLGAVDKDLILPFITHAGEWVADRPFIPSVSVNKDSNRRFTASAILHSDSLPFPPSHDQYTYQVHSMSTTVPSSLSTPLVAWQRPAVPSSLSTPLVAWQRPTMPSSLSTPPWPVPVLTSAQSVLPQPGDTEEDLVYGSVQATNAKPLKRLLAELHNEGMDILFPQSTHDKVLAIIFAVCQMEGSVSNEGQLAKLTAIQESKRVSQLESVNMTQVQGVLTLLTRCKVLTETGQLTPKINSFEEIRKWHDQFLLTFMFERDCHVSDVVWLLDKPSLDKRIAAMNKVVMKIQIVLYSQNADSSKPIPSGSVLIDKNVCCPLCETVTLTAAGKGHRFCLSSALGLYATHPDACTAAARGGHLDCLTLLYEYHAPNPPWDKTTTNACAERGDLASLTYTIENGCPHDTDNIVALAAASGNLSSLEYLIEGLGLYMNEDGSVFGAAFERADYTCVLYLLDAGCPFVSYVFGDINAWPAYQAYHTTVTDIDARFLMCIIHAVARGWSINTEGVFHNPNLVGYIGSVRHLFPQCVLHMATEGWIEL